NRVASKSFLLSACRFIGQRTDTRHLLLLRCPEAECIVFARQNLRLAHDSSSTAESAFNSRVLVAEVLFMDIISRCQVFLTRRRASFCMDRDNPTKVGDAENHGKQNNRSGNLRQPCKQLERSTRQTDECQPDNW